MRVVAGRLGGRIFEAPAGHRTHPMSEKIRGAIFNALGDITNLTVLDGFSGSGALCFEAISRGAAEAIGIDIDKRAISTAVKSAKVLGVTTEVKFIQANSSSWSDAHSEMLFDIVLLDPPYDDVKTGYIEKLARHTKIGGIAVVSLPPSVDLQLNEADFDLLSKKDYNDATLAFYRRKS
jgi:16S rRNA (guanine966-N2)-methyltransferase